MYPTRRSNSGAAARTELERTGSDDRPEYGADRSRTFLAAARLNSSARIHMRPMPATAPAWMTSIIKEYGGNPYQHLVDMAKMAQKKGVIKGILLHQGESNTNDKDWPNKVAKIYNDLIR